MLTRLRAGIESTKEVVGRAADRNCRATLYHQGTPATRYWRIDLPAKFLPGKSIPAHELTVRHWVDTNRLTFPQLRGDTAVIQYPGDNGTAVCTLAMEARGKRLLVETDDNYLEYGDSLWMKRASWGEHIRHRETPHTVEGHRWIVEHSAGVIVTTRALAEVYGEVNPNVHVCRNSIDPSDWAPPAERDNVFRIGWYASDSHDRDAPLIAKALSWASRQPGVEVLNIGHDPGWPFRRTQVGWTDSFLNQRAHLRRLDVGVSPIAVTRMATFRSDLKALEYAMGGAMPFLQRAEPYWEWVDRDFVRMCSAPSDWMDAIRWAVRNQDEVRARAVQAREYVLAHRTFATEIDRWRTAIEGGR